MYYFKFNVPLNIDRKWEFVYLDKMLEVYIRGIMFMWHDDTWNYNLDIHARIAYREKIY